MSEQRKEQVSSIAYRAVIICVCLNLCTGVQNCWSMLGRSMIAEYGWTAQQASMPYSVMMVFTACYAIVAGKIGDYLKPKYATLMGGICFGLGLIIAGRTHNWIVMTIAVGCFLGVASTSVTVNTAGTAVKFWPSSKRGLISGIVTASVGLASFYMSPIVNGLLGAYGVEMTFTILGIAALILFTVFSVLLPTPTKEMVEGNAAGADASKFVSKYNNTISGEKSLKTVEMWVIFLLMGCAAMSGQTINAHIASMAETQAGWVTGAAIITMIVSAANAGTRLVIGGISDKIGVMRMWKIIFAVGFVNLLAFHFYTSPALISIGTIILVACYGCCVPLTWATIEMVYGKKHMSSIYGYCNVSFGLAAFIGPQIAAYFFDTTGSYTQIFYVIAAFYALGFILSFVIREKRNETEA